MQCFSNFTAYNTYVSSQKEKFLTFSFLKDVKRPTTNATNMKQARIFFAHIVLSPKHVFVCDSKDPPVVAVCLHSYSVFINFPNAISSLSDICLTVHRRRRRVFLLPLSLLSLSLLLFHRREEGRMERGEGKTQAASTVSRHKNTQSKRDGCCQEWEKFFVFPGAKFLFRRPRQQ